MDSRLMEQYKKWFDQYVATFVNDDGFVNANIELKREHTKRVCEETNLLTGSLGMGPEDRLTAETIALFHDVGRFEQFSRYRTFSDAKSIDHAALAVEILDRDKLLDCLADQEAQIVRTAVCLHGKKDLPPGLDGRTEHFAKLIRDTDKIDIYYVAIQNYREYKNRPEGLVYELPEPEEPFCSPDIVASVLNGEKIEYSRARTINDIKLLQIGWVYDINFEQSLLRIRQRRFLLQLLALLPRTEEVIAVARRVTRYIDDRIEKAGL